MYVISIKSDKLLIAICEDDVRQAQYTKKLVLKNVSQSWAEVDCFHSSETLLSYVAQGSYMPDIAILDIKFDGMSGIELAKELNAKCPWCKIIYLSGYAEYCSDIYSTEHIFFILKDNAEKYMPAAIEKAVSQCRKRNEEFLSIISRGTTSAVRVDSITYIESSLRKLFVHTSEGVYETYARMDEILSPEQARFFVRCHQSYLVNLKYAVGIDGSGLVLSVGKTVPISRSRYTETKKRFLEYLTMPGNSGKSGD